jgi:hypothetical protein
MRHRLALVVLAAALLVASRPASAQDASPATRVRGEIAALVSAVDAGQGAGLAFVSTASSLNFIRGHAWILTLAVHDAPAYGGEYFILSEIDGRLTGELLQRAGPDGTRVVTGEALARFLEQVELDAAPIRAAYARHYGRR